MAGIMLDAHLLGKWCPLFNNKSAVDPWGAQVCSWGGHGGSCRALWGFPVCPGGNHFGAHWKVMRAHGETWGATWGSLRAHGNHEAPMGRLWEFM